MSRARSFAAVLGPFALATTGCLRELPPPPVPSPAIPKLAIDPGPVAEGKARVLIDTVDGRERVYVERAHEEHDEIFHVNVDHYEVSATNPTYRRYVNTTTETHHGGVASTEIAPLCKTPCAADLPPGRYRLHFEPDVVPNPTHIARETMTVDFRGVTSVYRHAPGEHTSDELKHQHRMVSFAWIVAGVGLAATGVLIPATADEARAPDAALLGGTLIGLGALVAASGIVYAILTRPVEQPGRAILFDAPPAR